MDRFDNVTNAGNERALRRGVRVPDGDINLAWVKSPSLNPADNMVVVDTSLAVSENVTDETDRCRLYYADELGVLQEQVGENSYVTAVFDEQFPHIGDMFNVEENYRTTAGEGGANNEYLDSTILPYRHVSRFFHIDFAGLAFGDVGRTYESDHVKVVDGSGREYVDADGNKRYKVQLVATNSLDTTIEDASGRPGTQNAYRVWAFVDSNQNEDLYLVYNKIEVATDGTFKNQNINHREILNPQPYFEYVPEESDVVDPANRQKKWFTSKATTLKNQILGSPITDKDGYKVYVPRKAVGDPRIFQLFRWRLACDFVEEVVVDPTETRSTINVGVIVTNDHPRSQTPFLFYNMEKSQFNASGMRLVNPLNEGESFTHPTSGETVYSPESKAIRSYWEVNLDELEEGQIEQFDFLVFGMASNFDFDPYLGLFRYFTEDVGGTIFIDTCLAQKPINTFWTTSAPVDGNFGTKRQSGTTGTILGRTIDPEDTDDDVWNGGDFGGWGFVNPDGTTDEFRSMLEPKYGPLGIPYWHDQCQTHHILTYPSDYDIFMHGTALQGGTGEKPVVVRKTTAEGGYIYLSTLGNMASVNGLLDPNGNYRRTWNLGDVAYGDAENQAELFQECVDNGALEGAYKFLYNLLLLAKRGTSIDDSDETSFATAWSFYTPWKSTWVIDGEVLSENERDRNDFVWAVKDPTDPEQTWQRKLSERTVEELMDSELKKTAQGREDLRRIMNMERVYRFEITNDNVEMPTTIVPETRPHAWTEAYSPPFEVPRDLGPNVILEETVEGEFKEADYNHISYPPKPFRVRVGADYTDTLEQLIDESVTITATGKALETVVRTTPIVHSTSEIFWSTHGYKTMNGGVGSHNYGPAPAGMTTWAEENYYTSLWGNANLHWFHYGLFTRLTYGSTGEVVQWIQHVMNRFMDLGVFGGSHIAVDGRYGPATANAVLNFQRSRGARFQDGIVDAETYGLIGYQVLRFQNQLPFPGVATSINMGGYYKYYAWPRSAQLRHLSDNSAVTGYTRRSWSVNGPPIIQDHLTIKFPQRAKILGIYLRPFMPNYGVQDTNIVYRPLQTRTIRLDHIHVADDGGGADWVREYMRRFNPAWAQVQNLNAIIGDNQRFWVPLGPYFGDQVTISISSTGPAGFGTAHVLGVRDFSALAEFTTGGQTYIEKNEIDIEFTKTVSVRSNEDVTFLMSPQGYTGGGTLSKIRWTDIDVSNPDVGYVIDGNKVTLQHSQIDILSSANHTRGATYLPPLSGETNYDFSEVRSMNEDGLLNPGPETGWITKTDGIKLLCDSEKRPIGFPDMPTGIGPYEHQRLFTTLSVTRQTAEASIIVGFYDFADKELIVNQNGEAKMSYAEYMARGAENVYVAVISEYQLEERRPLPGGESAPPLPYRWAMPVYGACRTSRTRIGIEPLPDDLGPSDMWYVPIRTGEFNRAIAVPTRFDNPVVDTWQRDYEGRTLKAFYSVPEAHRGGWSGLYGRPYKDIRGEHPNILDDNVIQVRQAPILMWHEPTRNSGAGDPFRPVVKVYTRPTVASAWTELSRIDILDYNSSNGTIILRNPLAALNPDLVKVDYTTSRTTYPFKGYGSARLNLNPYPGHNRDLIGKAIYIYILPHFVKDPDTGRVIPESYTTSTLRWSTDSGVFDPYDPAYNPFALQLGVIYITTALDVRDLVVLDTRRRGGGARDTANEDELERLVQDAIGYWDIGHGAGMSYQRGGFVIIRLPRALEEQWPDEREIIDIIKRNITAGVEFKIEDLSGADW